MSNPEKSYAEFEFLDPGKLEDEELELVLVKKHPPDPVKEWVAAYEFEMRYAETGEKMGEISLRIGNNDNTFYGPCGLWSFGAIPGSSIRITKPEAAFCAGQKTWNE